jgi:hypothetical protein
MGKMGGGKTSQNQLVSKNCRQHYWRIRLAFVLFLGMGLSNDLFAQFQAALISEEQVGLKIDPQNTNCDNIQIGADRVMVTTFSDFGSPKQPGFSWKVEIAGGTWQYRGYTLLGSTIPSVNIYYPDIVLVKDIGGNQDLHALVAFFKDDGFQYGWYIEDFLYDSNTKQFNQNGIVNLDNGSGQRRGTTVNIDATDNGKFAVIYDDQAYRIFTVSGVLNDVANNGITINWDAITGRMIELGEIGRNPDIALYEKGGLTTAYATYINGSINFSLNVSKNDWSIFESGYFPYGNRVIYPFRLTGALYYPRIACPNGNMTLLGDQCTVVLHEIDNTRTNNSIIGYNSNTINTKIVYNNGLYVTNGNLTSVSNSLPVVTYDFSNKVWVGWNFDNSSGLIAGAKPNHYPIALLCNDKGIPTFIAPNTRNLYYEVPTSTYLNPGEGNNLLSIAGRYCEHLYMSYYNSFSKQINYKNVFPVTPFFRTTNDENNTSSIAEYFLNLEDDCIVEWKLFSLDGKLVSSNKTKKMDGYELILESIKEYDNGIFIISIRNSENSHTLNTKVANIN